MKSIGTIQVNVQKKNTRLGRHAVIVGGGISGLSTAFFLSRRIAREHLPLRITVLEASDRFGGVLRTLMHEGFRIEAGADAFYTGQNDAMDLCRELGLQEYVVKAPPCFQRFFSLKNKKPFLVPGLPGSFFDVIRLLNSPQLSFFAKCRMFCEPFVPRRKEEGDESFASFVRRRLGQAFYQKIAKPLVRGVYMMD
ncbi:MAG: protoporphyrinogen oxidase, partial [Candidatus Omnitrophota bacterium]